MTLFVAFRLMTRLFKSQARIQRVKCSSLFPHFLFFFHFTVVTAVVFCFEFFHCYGCPRYKCHKLKDDIIVALFLSLPMLRESWRCENKNYYNTLVVRHLFIFPYIFFHLSLVIHPTLCYLTLSQMPHRPQSLLLFPYDSSK